MFGCVLVSVNVKRIWLDIIVLYLYSGWCLVSYLMFRYLEHVKSKCVRIKGFHSPVPRGVRFYIDVPSYSELTGQYLGQENI